MRAGPNEDGIGPIDVRPDVMTVCAVAADGGVRPVGVHAALLDVGPHPNDGVITPDA